MCKNGSDLQVKLQLENNHEDDSQMSIKEYQIMRLS